MSFSTVIVMACFCTVFLFASGLYVNYFIEGIDVAKSLLENSEIAYDYVHTIINITDFYTETGETCYFNVTNLGSTSIMVKDFPKIDVVLTYISNQTGSYVTVWLEYSDQSGIPNTWSLNAIYDDFIDPIALTQRKGLWNPSEKIRIAATLPSENTLMLQKKVTVTFCTPNGASDQKKFNT